MNMFKKLVVAVAFLCVATVVNAEEGIRIGARFGYSMQSVAYNMGMLGLRAGVSADIPIAGPVFISPEAAFLYRNNWSSTGIFDGKAVDWTQHEYAASIPVMIKFFMGLSSYIAIGAQVDIPIAAKECFGDDCRNMDGKTLPYFTERADYDVGIALSFGYIITPYLAFDVRSVYGLTPHHTYEEIGISGKIKSDPLSSYGFGITYFFL